MSSAGWEGTAGCALVQRSNGGPECEGATGPPTRGEEKRGPPGHRANTPPPLTVCPPTGPTAREIAARHTHTGTPAIRPPQASKDALVAGRIDEGIRGRRPHRPRCRGCLRRPAAASLKVAVPGVGSELQVEQGPGRARRPVGTSWHQRRQRERIIDSGCLVR